MTGPTVSVIMPSLNVGKYIKKCLDSVRAQSLENIEIICVDAGSDDGTLEYIKECAECDSRIKMIISDRKSYGYQMNLGLDAAAGDYIGIVETDDYADRNMFADLYGRALKDDADVIKSAFWFYYSMPKERNIKYKLPKDLVSRGIFSPADDITDPLMLAKLFNIKPSIWSGIYKRAFLEKNNIRFNESAGASFQDSGFNFKVWACADRAVLVNDAYLHYRQDNENSSVNSHAKAFCICDEYADIGRYIEEHFKEDTEKRQMLCEVLCRIKYDGYLWNYGRLNGDLGMEFLRSASIELAEDMRCGHIKKEYFPPFKWEALLLWTKDPEVFAKQLKERNEMTFAAKAIDRLKRRMTGR